MKNIIIVIMLMASSLFVRANVMETKYNCIWSGTIFEDYCDTCGCGGNGGSMGFGTGLNNNFVGLRYIGQKYRSRDGIFENSPWINENFNTLQAWGKFPVGNRVIVNAIIPFHSHNRRFSDNSKQDIQGIGDATLLGFYQLLKPIPDSIISIKPKHILQIGGGVKLPTGNFEEENLGGSVNPSFQLGTGSLDYILAINYGITHRNWGISALLNYTIKTENRHSYLFGNQWNVAVNMFKTYYLSDAISLTPQLGLGVEYFEKNKEFGLEVNETGGDVYLARFGLETSYNRYALGISSMLPLAQNLNNGKVEVKNRISFYVNINI